MSSPETLLKRIEFMENFYSLKKVEEYAFSENLTLLCGLCSTDTHVYCTDRNTAYVYAFDRQLRPAWRIDLSGVYQGTMPLLSDIVRLGNVLLVSDIRNREVYSIKLTGTGSVVFFSDSFNNVLDSSFALCAGSVDVYVLNADEKKVYCFNRNGEMVKQGEPLEVGADDLNRLFFSDSSGRLFVGSRTGEIWELDSDTLNLMKPFISLEAFCRVNRVTDFCVIGDTAYFVDAKAGRLIKAHSNGSYCYWQSEETDMIRLFPIDDSLFATSAPGRQSFGSIMAFCR